MAALKERGVKVHEVVEQQFKNKGMSLTGLANGWEPFMKFEFKYVALKKDGSPEKRQTDASINVYCSYCPFCGEKKKHNN
jgi:hypothetical protein